MLPIPSNVAIFFLVELIGCSLYSFFLLILSASKQAFLNTPFFKLFISTGFAGIGVITTNWLIQLTTYLPVQKESAMLIYISNGSATFCYTLGKLLIVVNRVTTLLSIETTRNIWSPRTTFVVIFCQYIVPLVAHFYFAITPVNWVDGAYKGLDSATGSIYRTIIGVFYALYALIGVALNVFVVKRLRNLSLSSTRFYRQQRSLTWYTIASTMTHVVFALHQFAWTYAFIAADRQVQLSVRGMKPFVYGLTTFSDPVVLFLLSGKLIKSQSVFP